MIYTTQPTITTTQDSDNIDYTSINQLNSDMLQYQNTIPEMAMSNDIIHLCAQFIQQHELYNATHHYIIQYDHEYGICNINYANIYP